MMTNTQLKLYRAVLARQFGTEGLVSDEVAMSREHMLPNGEKLTYRVGFDGRQWVLSFMVDDGPAWDEQRSYVLADIADDVGERIYDMVRGIEYALEAADKEQAEMEAEADHLQELATIGGLSDDDLVRGYENAVVEDMRTTDCVQEWGWHPDYTGPDDPGRGYYQEQSRLAGEIRDAFESEMKRRGLYEAHQGAVRDRAIERRGYNDEPSGNYYPSAK